MDEPTLPTAIDGRPRRSAGRASGAGLGSFAVATLSGPWGPIQVATTVGALIGLAVLAPGEGFAADLVRRTGRQAGHANAMLDRAVGAVEAFLAGESQPLETLPIDLSGCGEWDRAVLMGVRRLGWGEVTSYGGIARAIGRTGAARAVGGAVGRNPIGLAIPCHRVIAGDGSLGGYGGDWFGTRDQLLEVKRDLLAREGVRMPARVGRP